MRVADAPSVADAIEEFEDMDGHLRPPRSRPAGGGADHAVAAVEDGDAAARSATAAAVKVVVGHRVGFAQAGDALEEGAHAFAVAGGAGHVAYPGRVVGAASRRGLRRCQRSRSPAARKISVPGQMQPGVGLADAAGRRQSWPTRASKAGRARVGGSGGAAVRVRRRAGRRPGVFAGQGRLDFSPDPASGRGKAAADHGQPGGRPGAGSRLQFRP